MSQISDLFLWSGGVLYVFDHPCPNFLWVNRVVLTVRRSLPVFPHEQTSSERSGMSQRCQQATSFDHAIGAGEQCRWHAEAERLRSLEIDNQVKLGRLLDRNVSRLGPSQYHVDVFRRPSP
jgi:hypothetical protein